MMRPSRIFLIIYAVALCSASCGPIKQAGTHDLESGYYRLKTRNTAPQNVYTVITDSSVAIHSLIGNTKQPVANATRRIVTNDLVADSLLQPFVLVKRSLDFDLSTILLKYRFRNQTLPNQLSGNLNAAIYSGYRNDFFKIRDKVDPLSQRRRVIQHFEFDMGVFAGFGSTPVNPSTTANIVSVEYDGVIFQKGIACFIGSGNFAFGIGLGSDRLLDTHKKEWIYQEKPWMGVMIGLNLSN